jgi:glycosyltransferase involved in cell wall biosynthesis
MKVLYILNATTVYGGATKSFMPLLEGMKENGVEVCVVVPDSAGIYDVLNKKGIETYVVKMKHNVYPYKVGIKGHLLYIPRIIGRLLVNWFAVRKLKNIFKNKKIDIIHTNVSVLDVGYRLSRFLGVSHIYHFREYADLDFGMYYFPSKKYLYKELKAEHSYALCITKGVMNHHHLNDFKNVRMIYDPVLPSVSTKPTQAVNHFFLYAGRIEETKGLLDLLEAYAVYVKETEKPMPLHVAGEKNDEKYWRQIQNFVDEHRLTQSVVFLGQVKDIEKLMGTAWAIVIPSRFEGFGRCMPEAMFNGCLVIGKDCAGTKEQFDNGLNYCGQEIGFRYQTQEKLVEILKYVSQMTVDERAKITDEAFETVVNTLSTDISVGKVLNFYKEILNDTVY